MVVSPFVFDTHRAIQAKRWLNNLTSCFCHVIGKNHAKQLAVAFEIPILNHMVVVSPHCTLLEILIALGAVPFVEHCDVVAVLGRRAAVVADARRATGDVHLVAGRLDDKEFPAFNLACHIIKAGLGCHFRPIDQEREHREPDCAAGCRTAD